MATSSKHDDPAPEPEWLPTFHQNGCNTLLHYLSAELSAPTEIEYAELIIDIIQRLLSWADSVRYTMRAEEWGQVSPAFQCRLIACLDPEDSLRGQPHSFESLGLKWQLMHDEVEKLARADNKAESMNGRRDLDGKGYLSLPGLSPVPSASTSMYVDTLEHIRDRPLPPPEIGAWVDIGRLRRWIDHCDGNHSAHCGFSNKSKKIFKHRPRWLVDTKRMCLVRSYPTQRYVALSYVWGVGTAFKTLKQNIRRLQDKHSLQSHNVVRQLPATIRDVIKLTRQIGERFLWVDSLCIVQDDDKERREQLERMGSIYANAYITIVAAGGTAFTGLRGIKDVTPPMERKSEVPRHLLHSEARWLHNVLKKSHDKLQASAWNRRAWTFQEQIFSRRMLVFDNTSLTWECHCAVWLEGMEPEEGQCQNNKEMVAQGFSFGIEPSLRDYARHVAEFNRRELSYPQDALDAFGGILETLSSTAFAGGFTCGLPVMFFDAAILWYNESPLERRDAKRSDGDNRGTNFGLMPPSWAWAAWGGTVAFLGCERNVDGSLDVTIRPLVQWEYKALGQEDWQPVRATWPEKPQQIHTVTEKPALGSSTDDSQEHKNKTDGVRPPLSPLWWTRPPLLRANPLRAFFRVLKVVGEVQLLLADGVEGCAGMISSCESLTKDKGTLDHPVSCEVVVVSESVVNGTDAYNALWIEWKDGIAYRKGVGRIMKTAWEAAKPERIWLVLG